MFKLIDHIPHISFASMVELGVVSSESYLKKALHQQRTGKVSCWPHTKQGREVWLNFEGLKPHYRQTITNLLGDPYTALKQQAAAATLQQHNKAQQLLADLHQQHHRATDIQHLRSITNDITKATDLAWGAAWLRCLNAYRTSTDTRAIGYNTKAELRESVLQAILDDMEHSGLHRYGFKVRNLRVLQNKEISWRKAMDAAGNNSALETLVPNYQGNSNAQKIGKGSTDNSLMLLGDKIDLTEFHAATLIYLFMNPGKANKFDYENIHLRYTRKCRQQGEEPVSLSAVKHFLNRNEVRQFTVLERDGWAEFDKTAPHVYGKRAEMSLSKGGYDGFSVDFYTDVDGARLMLTCVAVFDYASEAITGYDIGLVEDGRMVRNMYLNHLNTSNGRSYMEIESDRFSGNLAKQTQRLFTACCNKVTMPAPNDPRGRASNPKARFVERLLQELNRLTQNVDGWKGTNITSIDRSRKPNTDYSYNTQATYAHGVQQLIQLVNVYNNMKLDKYNGQSRMERYQATMNPAAPEVSAETRALLMGHHTIATVRNAKLELTVNRRKYEYAWPQYHRHLPHMAKGNKVRVYFDEQDMEEVTVFGYTDKHDTGTDRYLTTLSLLNRAQRAVAEQTTEDKEAIGRMTHERDNYVGNSLLKQLEFEANYLGIELPTNASIKEKRALLDGARAQQKAVESFEQLYNEELAQPLAEQGKDYYEDRLLRNNGHAAPIEQQTSTQSKRDFIRNLNK